MKISNALIKLQNGSVVLDYSLSPADLLRIEREKLFNFESSLFEKPPARVFSKGTIQIIAEEKNRPSVDQFGELTLDDKDWQVLSLELDNIVYPTFLSLRREGKLPGSLVEAMTSFATQKASGDKLPEKERGAVKRALTRIVEMSSSGKVSGRGLSATIAEFIGSAASNSRNGALSETIEAVLANAKVSFTRDGDSYSFYIRPEGHVWHSTLCLPESGEGIYLLSSTPLQITEAVAEALLREIDQLNETFTDARFEIDPEKKLLIYRSYCAKAAATDESQLSAMLTNHNQACQAIIVVLAGKFGSGVRFQDQ